MRALILSRPGPVGDRELTLRSRADPAPAPGELLLRVHACAVCRTDLQIVGGEIAPHRPDVVPGHQVAGVVEALGDGVTGWKVGDRAGIGWLAGVDETCRHCRAGRENLCEQAAFTGWDRDGGFAELTTLRADVAVHLPDGFDDLAAAPLLCGGVIGFRSLKVSGIKPGGRLGLYGFGASALQTIQVARHWDCEVYVTTRSDRDRARARALGAVWVGGYEERPPAPLDAAVTFAPVGDAVIAALEALDRGGTVAINAIHLDGIPAFDYEHLWWERSIRSVANFTRADAREYMALAAEIPVQTQIETFPLSEGVAALDRLAAGEIDGAAVIVP